MQGAESTAFEAYLRTYGVSDAVQIIRGRAFDRQAGLADAGVTIGVEPLSVLLSFIERGLDDDERTYEPRSLPAALVSALQLTPISIASKREAYFRKLLRGEEPVPLLPSDELTSVLENSRRLSRDVSGNKSMA